MTNDSEFWLALDTLVNDNEIIIDRAKNSTHPNFPDYIYPLDYGHIDNTKSTDGAEIDCWVGSLGSFRIDSKLVDGVIMTIDSAKQDSEIKVLINCKDEEMSEILKCHQRGMRKGLLVRRN